MTTEGGGGERTDPANADRPGSAPPRETRRRRGTRIIRALLVTALVAGLLVGALAALQRQLIYFPTRSDPGPAANHLPGGQDITLHTEDGLDLNAWLLPPTTPADRHVAVLHANGNGGNRGDRVPLLRELTDRGLTVLAMDYRGYGGNPGSPDEDGLAADARAGAAFLREHGFDPAHTVYFGESLGTGVVTRLATTDPPAALVLRSPYTALVDVGARTYPFLPVRTMLRDRYPLLELMPTIQAPVTVIRGTDDHIVPTFMSEQVARAAPHLTEDLVLEAGHNDVAMFGPSVARAVIRAVEATR